MLLYEGKERGGDIDTVMLVLCGEMIDYCDVDAVWCGYCREVVYTVVLMFWRCERGGMCKGEGACVLA